MTFERTTLAAVISDANLARRLYELTITVDPEYAALGISSHMANVLSTPDQATDRLVVLASTETLVVGWALAECPEVPPMAEERRVRYSVFVDRGHRGHGVGWALVRELADYIGEVYGGGWELHGWLPGLHVRPGIKDLGGMP